MKHARRERGVDTGFLEHVTKVLHRARAARRNERHRAQLARRLKLLDVVAALHAVTTHAIEDDFPGAALLHLANPLKRVAPGVARSAGVAGELIHAPAVGREMTVHANHDALRAET